MLKNLKDWKTTLTGVVMVLVFALNAFNLVNPEEGEAIKSGVQEIVNAYGGSLVGFIGTIGTVVGGVLLLFVKDPKKEKK